MNSDGKELEFMAFRKILGAALFFLFVIGISLKKDSLSDIVFAKEKGATKLKKVKLKEYEFNKEAGRHNLTGDVIKLEEFMTEETISDFMKRFTPFSDDTADILFVNIYTKENNENHPYMKYFKIKSKNSDYMRENLYICTNNKQAINYTFSNSTNTWKKQAIETNCLKSGM